MRPHADWIEANQRYLTESLTKVYQLLESGSSSPRPNDDDRPGFPKELGRPALETLSQLFGLTPFERDVLVLCAGAELDAGFASAVGTALGASGTAHPTLGLALASLPEPHWSAISTAGPLRYWRLIEIDGQEVTRSPLRIDERILHFLTGLHHLDERLAGFVEPFYGVGGLVPSHRGIADRLATLWTQNERSGPLPVVQLCGSSRADLREVTWAACAELGLPLHATDGLALPIEPRELEALSRLWNREALLTGSALLIDVQSVEGDPTRDRARAWFIEHVVGPVVLAAIDPIALPRRTSLILHLERPTHQEQRALWADALGKEAPSLDGQADSLIAQFDLDRQSIRSVAAEVLGRLNSPDRSSELDGEIPAALWEACRERVRPRMEGLAQRITPRAEWDDLVLPESQRTLLREIAAHVRHRIRVYETWAFAQKSARGLGISALFVGQSGTGKTMAAEVLANVLNLDLYRIDLSQVVSKYIGETEKNLRKVFDGAEGSGAILLFDEADALFGKRSEVRDSHDRYANIEISYLLQRMEDYRGLAILTTNMKGALDQAFLRRIRFVVQFPFPDLERRAAIWRGAFPAETPTEGLDIERLARLSVAGGNIRSIAMYAAFLAADAGEPVSMSHMLRATRVEYAKLEKTPTESEIGGWV